MRCLALPRAASASRQGLSATPLAGDTPVGWSQLYLHQLVPAVLTMGVGKRLCADPAVEDHRSLCNAAARVVGGICHSYGAAYTNLQPRITKALLAPASSCCSFPSSEGPIIHRLTTRFGAAAEGKGSDDAPVDKKAERSRKEAPKAPKSAVGTAGEARACQAALHAAVRRLPIQLARVCMCVSLCGPKPRCCTPDAHPMHTRCTPAAHLPCFRSGCTFVISTGGLKSPRSKQQLCRLHR